MTGMTELAGGFTDDDLPRLRYGPGHYDLLGGVLVVSHGEFTADLVESLPDDGNRHQLLQGTLVVTPAPSLTHQRVLFALARLMADGCPSELMVVMAPFAVRIHTSPDTTVEPDLVVARKVDLTERNLPAPPVLAVEVLSPSTRSIDLVQKKSLYESAGWTDYWVLDPDAPRLVAWRLVSGRYVEVADVSGEEKWTATTPYAVTIRPEDLLR